MQDPPYFNFNDPSKLRREALMAEMGTDDSGNKRNGVPTVSSFFKIERYYDMADKVLAAFEEAYGKLDLDTAFVYGKRYCMFVFDCIPTHNYYKRAENAYIRKKHLKDAETVLKCLEEIKTKMDEEELQKYEKRYEAWEAQQAQLEKERVEKENATYQELLKRAERQKNHVSPPSPSENDGDIEQSAYNKLDMLLKKPNTTPDNKSPAPPRRPSGRYALSDTEEDDDQMEPPPSFKIAIGEPMPPPLPPPDTTDDDGSSSPAKSNGSLPPPSAADEAPPPYDSAINPNRHNPFLGPRNGEYKVPPPISHWGDPRPPSYTALPDPPSRRYPSQSQHAYNKQPQQPPSKRKKKIPVRHLRDQARLQYHKLIDEERIQIRPIGTYQGRYTQSTNGCTVISPLVVARHLSTSSGVLITNEEIKRVIDSDCPPLLREIRGKLGLEGHSLIIPSDVHDHLVDKKILKQEHFVGATGGNIISEEHIDEFLKLFQDKDKAGAALFFREHVVSIVKIPTGHGAFYDLVDSMPGTKDARNNPCATRTRCKDEEALRVLLSWYATKKFSESNCSYIDNNDWNDMMADLDPRVFQAFVWGKDL